MNEKIVVEMEFDNESKNFVRFKEFSSSDHDTIIGTIDIPKDELAELDWDEENIIITIEIKE